MKLLVVSDTHMFNEIFESINQIHQDIDIKIHCGDSSLKKDDPLLQGYYVVKGNHDLEDFDEVKILTLHDKKIMITHGSLFQVYAGDDALLSYMNEHDIDICFHGHTHVPCIHEYPNNKLIINPGSTMINRGSYGYGTYIIASLDDQLSIDFYHHQTHQKVDNKILIESEELLAEFKTIMKQMKK